MAANACNEEYVHGGGGEGGNEMNKAKRLGLKSKVHLATIGRGGENILIVQALWLLPPLLPFLSTEFPFSGLSFCL